MNLVEKYVFLVVNVVFVFNIVVFNVGIVIGFFVGGLIVDLIGFVYIFWIGGVMVLGVVLLIVWSCLIEVKVK